MLYKQNQSYELDESSLKILQANIAQHHFGHGTVSSTKIFLTSKLIYSKKMGFGGFHMHSRIGMSTPYLKDEFMGLIKFCTQKAEQENMLAYLYDEDRWPSGSAGGYVTKLISTVNVT